VPELLVPKEKNEKHLGVFHIASDTFELAATDRLEPGTTPLHFFFQPVNYTTFSWNRVTIPLNIVRSLRGSNLKLTL
jgi:hypothetical protein